MTLRWLCVGLVCTMTTVAIAQSAKRRPATERPTKKMEDGFVFEMVSEKQRDTWEDMADEIHSLIKKGDALGVRVVLKKLAKLKPDKKTWTQVRSWLHESPWIGWDLLRYWEKSQPAEYGRPILSPTDAVIASSAKLLYDKKFEAAFNGFQKVARVIKKDMDKGNVQNRELYYQVLHLMSGALYGSGRFADALLVNTWIPPIYSKYRQVLFERMWAAFRAGRIDIANGAIASQYSSYFNYLEPEAFLVQTYLYRKMCRDGDFQLVIKNLKKFHQNLKSGRFNLSAWLKTDLQYRSYLAMLKKQKYPSASFASNAERLAEKKLVQTVLSKMFALEKARLLREVERIFAFANLALSATTSELPIISKLPPQEELLKSGLEMWPVSDAEDWLDELGHHVFIGESQCRASEPSPTE